MLEGLLPRVAAARRVLLVSGAGISVGAGLPTYRGAGGLYESGRMPPLHRRDTTAERLPALWEHVSVLAAASAKASPSRAHEAIAAFAAADTSRQVRVLTQNVDGLHAAAGGPVDVLELHGSLVSARCTGFGHRTRFGDWTVDDAGVPRCAVCPGRLRPDVVLFGERLDPGVLRRARLWSGDCDLLIVVGTSAEVFPAADLVEHALWSSGCGVWVNPAPPTLGGFAHLAGDADVLLPALLGVPANPQVL